MPWLIRKILHIACACLAAAPNVKEEEILTVSRPRNNVTDEGGQGLYVSGGDQVLKLKDDFGTWSSGGVTEVWIDEYYGTGPLNLKEAAALSQYAPLEHLTLGRSPENVHLSGEVLREFQKCPKLTGITMNVDRMGPDVLSALERFQNLRNLYIWVSGQDYSTLTKAAPSVPPDAWAASLVKLEKLEWLSVSIGQKTSNQFLEEMRKSKALRWLQLRNGTFDERSFDILGKMNLESLTLTVPGLEGLTLKGLEKSGIRRLNLEGDGLHRPPAMRDFNGEAWEVFLKMPELEELTCFEKEMEQGAGPDAGLAQIREKLANRLKENRLRHDREDRKSPEEGKSAAREKE